MNSALIKKVASFFNVVLKDRKTIITAAINESIGPA
jgi:hypothetical protein